MCLVGFPSINKPLHSDIITPSLWITHSAISNHKKKTSNFEFFLITTYFVVIPKSFFSQILLCLLKLGFRLPFFNPQQRGDLSGSSPTQGFRRRLHGTGRQLFDLIFSGTIPRGVDTQLFLLWLVGWLVVFLNDVSVKAVKNCNVIGLLKPPQLRCEINGKKHPCLPKKS